MENIIVYCPVKGNQKVRICTQCKNSLPIENFSGRGSCIVKNKEYKMIREICRECSKYNGIVKRLNTLNSRPVPTIRKCYVCKEIKPLTEFYNCKNNYLGKLNICKICNSKQSLEYQKKHPEIRLKWNKSEKRKKYMREYMKKWKLKKIQTFNQFIS